MGAPVTHGDQEVEGIVRVAHNEKQRGLLIAQGVQLQLVIGCDLPDLGYVEYRQTCAAAH